MSPLCPCGWRYVPLWRVVSPDQHRIPPLAYLPRNCTLGEPHPESTTMALYFYEDSGDKGTYCVTD